uniref:Capsid protein n=1 Tax=Caper carlavirus 1 TaxID=2794419 RepID=A0A7T5QZD6_9VIRU|nr:CP [Caper carlavirus 1]
MSGRGKEMEQKEGGEDRTALDARIAKEHAAAMSMKSKKEVDTVENIAEEALALSESNRKINRILNERLTGLTGQLRGERSAIKVTNPCFEIGRPRLNPTADMKGDVTNPYNRVSIDQLIRIKPKAISNNIATSEEIAKVSVKIEGMGVPTNYVQSVILQAVIYCKDASSSAYLDPQGSFEFPGGMIGADAVLAILKSDAATLRRICRLYAPITWNYMLTHNAPPSDWAAMGFDYRDRFAAFDCFDYIENEAAVKPLEGLIRSPTPREYIAHSTHRSIVLDRAARNEKLANYGVEITGGMLGERIERDFTKAPRK